MSDNRSSVVNLSRPIALALRTRCHGRMARVAEAWDRSTAPGATVVYRWHPTEMNAPAEAFRCQALAKEIAAELRAKYDLKAA